MEEENYLYKNYVYKNVQGSLPTCLGSVMN